MTTRRKVLKTIPAAAIAVAAASPAASQMSKIVGIDHRPKKSQKFTGPGWYAFTILGSGAYRVMWCEAEDHQFIGLSGGPGKAVEYSFSHAAFDTLCFGIWRATK